MEYIATFKEETELEGYYILIKAKDIEQAEKYMEQNYNGECKKVYPKMVYLRYKDEYNDQGLYREVKLKEVKIK